MTTTISSSTVISSGLLSVGGDFLIEKIPPSTAAVQVTIDSALPSLGVSDAFTVQNGAELIVAPDISLGIGNAFDIGENGTLILGSGISVGALDSVNFVGGTSGGDLVVGQGLDINLLTSINGFAAGDNIDFAGDSAPLSPTSYSSIVSGGQTNFTVTLTSGTQQFSLAGDYAGDQFLLGTSAAGITFTDEIPCFLAGTHISTARGEVKVEDLEIGDSVLLARPGSDPVSRKIVWLGHRGLDSTRHPKPQSIWPVLIRADAFAPGVPARDLRVSPGHALFFGGVLIQADKLLNGLTILQERRPRMDYWHVELDGHDILFAEGLPAESYLDTGNRAAFANGAEFMEIFPDFAPKHWAHTCVPLVLDGPEIARAKAALLARAKTLGHEITTDDDLHVLADGVRIDPIRLNPRRRAFLIQAGASNIRLQSRTFVPAFCIAPSNDQRRLGICVSRLQIDGSEVRLDSESLQTTGWHSLEHLPERPAQRWTTGTTELAPNTRLAIIDLATTGYYWAEEPGINDNIVPLFG